MLNFNDGTVGILLNQGDGGFAPQVTFAAGSSPAALVIGDFAQNGLTDLAVADSTTDLVSVLLNVCQ